MLPVAVVVAVPVAVVVAVPGVVVVAVPGAVAVPEEVKSIKENDQHFYFFILKNKSFFSNIFLSNPLCFVSNTFRHIIINKIAVKV